MIDPSDILASALPAAAFAGLVAVGVTLAIERFGGRTGGLLATLPTTIVPAALGIYAANPDAFTKAMDAVPPGMWLNALFLWLWRVIPGRLPASSLPRRLAIMSAISLGAWLVGAVILVLGSGRWIEAGLDTAWLGLGGFVLLVGAGVGATLDLKATPRGRRPVALGALALRGLFAALSVGAAVWVAAVGGEIAAGVVSIFPAIFLTAMVALWLAQGEAVPAGAVGPMMLGASSVAAFALYARWLMPALGPVVGACLAWPLAVISTTLPASRWLAHRARRGLITPSA